MARLIFHNPTKEQLEHIYRAEAELSLAGIYFDRSHAVDEGKIISRDWELDWSLEGAEIKEESKVV